MPSNLRDFVRGLWKMKDGQKVQEYKRCFLPVFFIFMHAIKQSGVLLCIFLMEV